MRLRWLALLSALLFLMACGDEAAKKPAETPAKPTIGTAKGQDPEAEKLRADKLQAQLAMARQQQATGDGERSGFRTASDAQDIAVKMAGLSRRPATGPSKPDIKGRNKPQEVFDDKGTINAKAVGSAFAQHRNSLQNCYERGLKRNPSLRGKVGLTVNIKSDGRVGFIKINKNTLKDPAVISCMTKRVKRFSFPKPEGGGVTVAKTFVFTPQT